MLLKDGLLFATVLNLINGKTEVFRVGISIYLKSF